MAFALGKLQTLSIKIPKEELHKLGQPVETGRTSSFFCLARDQDYFFTGSKTKVNTSKQVRWHKYLSLLSTRLIDSSQPLLKCLNQRTNTTNINCNLSCALHTPNRAKKI